MSVQPNTLLMRSKLIVPGDRPDLMQQALLINPDAISLDLEDMVRPERKSYAVQACLAFIASLTPAQRAKVIVRVNSPGSVWLAEDLARFTGIGLMLINVPKTQTGDEVKEIAAALSRLEQDKGMATGATRLLVNVETPRALRNVLDLATASVRVAGVQLGFADLLEPINISRADLVALHQIRLQVKLACAEAGVDAFDGGYPGLDDAAGFNAELQGAKRLGFAGKSCLTREQVDITHAVFTPTPAELQAAQRLVATADAAFAQGTGMLVVDGGVVDEPITMGARQLIARAQRYAQRGSVF